MPRPKYIAPSRTLCVTDILGLNHDRPAKYSLHQRSISLLPCECRFRYDLATHTMCRFTTEAHSTLRTLTECIKCRHQSRHYIDHYSTPFLSCHTLLQTCPAAHYHNEWHSLEKYALNAFSKPSSGTPIPACITPNHLPQRSPSSWTSIHDSTSLTSGML
jgi:hypothetical protein